jgi:hypothetical protein
MTLVFSAACIFTVEVHANPMWESADTRGADQECMCAASHSVGLLAMRLSRNRRNARRRLAPAAAPREAPSESSARWGDSATRTPDTPPPIGPTPHAGASTWPTQAGSLAPGDRSRAPRARPVTAPACAAPRRSRRTATTEGRRRENGRLAHAPRGLPRSPNRARRPPSSTRRRSRSPRLPGHARAPRVIG